MAGEYWDAGYFVETASGKTRFIKVGSARQRDDGGFWVNFDSLPLPQMDSKGNLRCSITIQQQKGRYGGSQQPAPQQSSGFDADAPF